jgi:WD40 repeat protein
MFCLCYLFVCFSSSYYSGGDKPYLISGGDDFLVKVWDYQNKKCIQTMEGPVSCVFLFCKKNLFLFDMDCCIC